MPHMCVTTIALVRWGILRATSAGSMFPSAFASANLMFCRETGQSVGAALFGALFNAAGNDGIAVATGCAVLCEERVAAGLRYAYFAGAGLAAAMVLLLLRMPRIPL